ncbi:response regulator [Evansella cellulosilytica]|uniref:Two component transcriptional regulator, LuxR family n=1 Tax=Evansella cellulosilytica (strain ATCC 21833 / DSM 2522 / FERM P-1141 / JCM 9156 / N-4) TaxID=649639 RepID=E6TXJ9_EVAC2|nr:response regulator transcription factor [Evansella cellulosilytica]ADU28813.1 two component transcriptional regulator, LuxR family [Evansella cellulosilytica DSM 2522]
MSDKLKVVIADDHPIVRDGFKVLLSTTDSIEVVGTAQNGVEVVELVTQLHPDVVLLDMYMPNKNGLEALADIKIKHPETKVLMISSMINDDVVIDCLSLGANGVLLKDWPTDKIIHAMKESVAGQMIIPECYSTKLIGAWKKQNKPQHKDWHEVINKLPISLYEREKEILAKIMDGKKNSEIARELYLSIGTIKNYTSSIYKKIGVSKRKELVEYVKTVKLG